MLRSVQRPLFRGMEALDQRLKRLAVHLVRWTGKSPQAIHPKHLLRSSHHTWYLSFIEPGDHVLDIGCGLGSAALAASGIAAWVIGFDYDSRHLQAAQALARQKGARNVQFAAADIDQGIPLRGGCLEKVLLLDVIEHLNNRRELLLEISRLLKPEGLLLLTAPNRGNRWKRIQQRAGLPGLADPDHKIEYLMPEVERELHSGGFEIQAGPFPTVLELPLAGLIDLVGGFHIPSYARLQRWKERGAEKHPEEATGWKFVCRKTNRENPVSQ